MGQANGRKYWIVHEDGGGTHGSVSYRIWWKITDTTATKIAVPTGKTLTYTGAAQTGVASGTGYTLSGTTQATNAGSYTATATLKSGYAWSDGSTAAKKVAWRIDPVAITSVSAASQIYDGKAKAPTPTVKAGSLTVPSSGYTASYGNNTNAGSATVSVTGKGNYTGTKSASFTIGKAASSVSVANKTATYNGKAIASSKAKVTGSTGKVTYAYYGDAKCTKSVKAANVKNAGTYYVKATVAADANHKAATSAAAKITIGKAANKLSAKAKTTKKKPLSAKQGKAAAFALSKYAEVTNPAKGALAYKRASGNAKIKVNAKNGKIAVAKGLAKGAYTVKVKVTSAATANYKSASKTVALYVKVS